MVVFGRSRRSSSLLSDHSPLLPVLTSAPWVDTRTGTTRWRIPGG
jgi:hypothetical protein